LATDLEKKRNVQEKNQPPIAEQAVTSSQLSSIEIGICGATAGMVSRFVIIGTVNMIS
jgi:hypothetical protein